MNFQGVFLFSDCVVILQPNPDNVIRAVVDYVRSIPDISNMDYVGDAIFRYKYQRITNLYLSENKKK
jgi:hypothetical protein